MLLLGRFALTGELISLLGPQALSWALFAMAINFYYFSTLLGTLLLKDFNPVLATMYSS